MIYTRDGKGWGGGGGGACGSFKVQMNADVKYDGWVGSKEWSHACGPQKHFSLCRL